MSENLNQEESTLDGYSQEYNGYEIAIIGMSGKFPGAGDVNTMWENIKSGVESISFFSDEEVLKSGVTQTELDMPGFVGVMGCAPEKEYFDAHFFGYLPDEARLMDPQSRLFHQCVWETLEDGGYNPEDYPGLIGLYAGTSIGFYWDLNVKLSA